MSKRVKWGIAFLGATALLVGWEVWFSVDGDPDTLPWTDWTVAYVPEELFYFIGGGLTIWFWQHFYRRYKARREAKRK